MATDYETLIEPVKSKRTFEEVSDKLKELIFSGTLIPGQRLPSEVALAQLFHVGRQSVREALRVLELSGFITVKSGVKGGAVIEGTILTKLAGLFLETFKLNKMSLQDCIEARKAIEVLVLDFVFRNATKDDVEALRNNVVKAKEKLHTNRSAFQEHVDFHRLLAQASKNYTLTVIVEIILAVFSDFTTGYRPLSLKETTEMAGFHEAIVDALAAKKKTAAVEFLRKDLGLAEKRLRGKTPVNDRIHRPRKKA
jgi:GntR family transcriptional regulator, transcriptional repressor for pyruvate dehydrogenase complex